MWKDRLEAWIASRDVESGWLSEVPNRPILVRAIQASLRDVGSAIWYGMEDGQFYSAPKGRVANFVLSRSKFLRVVFFRVRYFYPWYIVDWMAGFYDTDGPLDDLYSELPGAPTDGYYTECWKRPE